MSHAKDMIRCAHTGRSNAVRLVRSAFEGPCSMQECITAAAAMVRSRLKISSLVVRSTRRRKAMGALDNMSAKNLKAAIQQNRLAKTGERMQEEMLQRVPPRA